MMVRSVINIFFALVICFAVVRTFEAMPLSDNLEAKEEFMDTQAGAERKVADVEIKTDISMPKPNFGVFDAKRNYYMPNVFHATRGKRQFVSAVDHFSQGLLRIVADLRRDMRANEQSNRVQK